MANRAQELAGPRRFLRRPWTTVAAVAWLVILAMAYLAPAVSNGTSLGPFDILESFGLGQVHGVVPYNPVVLDQIAQMAPWNFLDWTQVHGGHLPLWDAYSGMGTPLAFNFQSAPFALSTIAGYLVPLRFAYTMAVFTKMVLAGTGVFFFCRTIKLSNLSALFAASVFELSGSFTGWLGWPQSSVICLIGWTLGATVLVLNRPGRPTRPVCISLFALVFAFCIYGGHPESLILVTETIAIVSVVYLTARIRSMPGSIVQALAPAVDLILGFVAGAALAAPLLLPGLPLLSNSARQSNIGYMGIPSKYLINLLAPGWFGLPITGHATYGPVNYYEAASYVGAIAMILTLFAILSRFR